MSNLRQFRTYALLTNATGVSTGTPVGGVQNPAMAFQANGLTTAGVGSATVKVQGSLDGSNWTDLGTITLSLSTTISNDGFPVNAPWSHVQATVVAITGTGASVSVNGRMAVE